MSDADVAYRLGFYFSTNELAEAHAHRHVEPAYAAGWIATVAIPEALPEFAAADCLLDEPHTDDWMRSVAADYQIGEREHEVLKHRSALPTHPLSRFPCLWVFCDPRLRPGCASPRRRRV